MCYGGGVLVYNGSAQHVDQSNDFKLSSAAQQQPPDGLLRAGGRVLPGHVPLAVPQEAADGHGDLHQDGAAAAGRERPGRARQARVRQAVQLDRGARQQGAGHQHQAALLHRRAGHLRVRQGGVFPEHSVPGALCSRSTAFPERSVPGAQRSRI